MKTYRNFSILIALAGAFTLSVLHMSRADEKKKTDETKAQLMFVQTAEDLKADVFIDWIGAGGGVGAGFHGAGAGARGVGLRR